MSRRFSQETAASAALSITMNGLASGGARACAAVDNESNKYQDALVHVHFDVAAGDPGNEFRVLVYAYGSEDGTHYTSPCTGVDEAVANPTSSPTLTLIGEIEVRAGGASYASQPMSVAQAFGWSLPRKWGIVVVNRTNLALGSSCGAHYSGIYGSVQ